jgi:hypothetical protein
MPRRILPSSLAVVAFWALAPYCSAFSQQSPRALLGVVLALDDAGSMRKNDLNSRVREAVLEFAPQMGSGAGLRVVLLNRSVRNILDLLRADAPGFTVHRFWGALSKRKPALECVAAAGLDLPAKSTDIRSRRVVFAPHPHLCWDRGVGRERDQRKRQLAAQRVDSANNAGGDDNTTSILCEILRREGSEG